MDFIIVLFAITAGLILAFISGGIVTYKYITKHNMGMNSRIKSAFLENMSHEIRTPLNSIMGLMELLLCETLNEKQSSYVRDIHISAQSLLSIIDDILDLSKIESKKMTLNPVDYDFNVFIDNIVSLFTFVAQRKGLGFIFESEGTLPMVLYGDNMRMRQVMTNICGNAVNFTEKGHVKLKVIAAPEKLTFIISDTGQGIPPNEIPKLFDAFESSGIKKNGGTVGTGLGLSVSKSYVEMMGGTISVQSEYDKGTIFTVVIPITAGHVADPVENIHYKQALSAPNAHVLVVDDNAINLKVAKGLLNLFNITAETASSGAVSIDMIKEKPYDIVFMDHVMPDMDGVEATETIRGLGFAKLPIIALTANVVTGAKEMFLEKGFNAFLPKPINIHELSFILKEYLPPDKISGRVEAMSSMALAESRSQFIAALDRIGAVNVEIGLSHAAGMESLYRDALEVFYRRMMQECFTLSAYLAVEDMNGFAAAGGTLKAMLANVGAIRLSEKASAMEIAASHDNLTFCLDTFPAFKDALIHLHEQLSFIFSNTNTKGRDIAV